jgi:hypothetical protein
LAGGELDAVLHHMTDVRLAQRVFDDFFDDAGRAGIYQAVIWHRGSTAVPTGCPAGGAQRVSDLPA